MTDQEKSGGVWAVCDRDYGEIVTKVYPTEIEALREVNERGYGRVQFVAWGTSLKDLEERKSDD